jgi:hypothetical protein
MHTHKAKAAQGIGRNDFGTNPGELIESLTGEDDRLDCLGAHLGTVEINLRLLIKAAKGSLATALVVLDAGTLDARGEIV